MKCPDGQYFCKDSQKCKPIPKGHHVMPDGELMKGEKHSVNEVAPPGFGHTKGDKEKGVKKGGTAAAFDKARKEGRFKGSKSDMFAIMWSQKNKGDKPHYKPGTDKKYKKYQEESTMPNVDSKDRKVIKSRAKNLFKKDLKGDHQGVNETVKDPTKKKPKAPQFNAAKELVTNAPYMKPALQQREGTSYKTFMADVQSAKDRLKKKVEDRKKKDAQFVDTKQKGVRFYDKKGKGRIVKGRKIYD